MQCRFLTGDTGAMKRTLSDLAVLGGAPAFETPLHVGRPSVGNRRRFLKLINELLERRWLTNNGPYVQELERRVEQLLGIEHCVMMSSGTVALEIAIRAAGLSGEVIVPSFTFIATPHALRWSGVIPVFCDVDRETHNLDPGRAEEAITERTTGLLAVHLWGRPCEIEALEAIAKRHQLKLLFDAGHAFGCAYQGRMIGNFGDAEVFSFHATKVFHTFEGGAIVTHDAQLAHRARLMRNFGFAGYDTVVALGINGKLSEPAAAMGLINLEGLKSSIAMRARSYRWYREGLQGLHGVTLLPYDETEPCTYPYVVLEIEEAQAGITRDELLHVLRGEQILARRYFYPGCHRMEPYCTEDPRAGERLPVTESLAARVLQLPTGTGVSHDAIQIIGRIIRMAVERGPELHRRLQRLPVSTRRFRC